LPEKFDFHSYQNTLLLACNSGANVVLRYMSDSFLKVGVLMANFIACTSGAPTSDKPSQGGKWLTWFYCVNTALLVAFIVLLSFC